MENKQERIISNFNTLLRTRGFKAFQIEPGKNTSKIYSRKDFYKICITTGKSRIHYADRSYEMEGTILFFGNPHIPYSWETISTNHTGYACLFSEDFLKATDRMEVLLQSPFFKLGGTPILTIDVAQRDYLSSLFVKMTEEQESDYLFKEDLIRNYIQLIIHEALKLKPSQTFEQKKNAAARISTVFLELLERQFPVESPSNPLKLRTAQDFAHCLHIHVNHLNRSLKETTGKATSTLIKERVLTEAKDLLQNTTWNITEIAYSLGFEYPTYFNNYFKKMTGTTPSLFRGQPA